jgi:hypothetical protein
VGNATGLPRPGHCDCFAMPRVVGCPGTSLTRNAADADLDQRLRRNDGVASVRGAGKGRT